MAELTKVGTQYYFRLKESDLCLIDVCKNMRIPRNLTNPPKGCKVVLDKKKPKTPLLFNSKACLVGSIQKAKTSKSVDGLYSWLSWNFQIAPSNAEFKDYFEIARYTVFRSSIELVDTSVNEYNRDIKYWLTHNFIDSYEFSIIYIPPKIDFSKYLYMLIFRAPTNIIETTYSLRDSLKGVLKSTDYRSAPGIFLFKDIDNAAIARLVLAERQPVFVDLTKIDINANFEMKE